MCGWRNGASISLLAALAMRHEKQPWSQDVPPAVPPCLARGSRRRLACRKISTRLANRFLFFIRMCNLSADAPHPWLQLSTPLDAHSEMTRAPHICPSCACAYAEAGKTAQTQDLVPGGARPLEIQYLQHAANLCRFIFVACGPWSLRHCCSILSSSLSFFKR
ncbi:hypothetical protein PSPO01_14518 [Paraphaeosphaeria sporulosa]